LPITEGILITKIDAERGRILRLPDKPKGEKWETEWRHLHFSPDIEDLFVGHRGVVPMLTFLDNKETMSPSAH